MSMYSVLDTEFDHCNAILFQPPYVTEQDEEEEEAKAFFGPVPVCRGVLVMQPEM